ncbi:hypothetical protein PFISCL1PPCAC_16434 [Pristionchus fissidentatus]|uniref:RING-type domain-containing protein n=1 Tax=Pristionchus fissidentatus TaxID=1538716 RepID=A0AAV5W4Y3_9BILA|nr:hypothetical protein PFISCL1PPCAC_16434 [Pristionchus fissidentatus]
MFTIPVQLSPRMLYGAPDDLAPSPNKECLKSMGLGLPSSTIGGANEKATSPKSPVKSPLSRIMLTHKSFFALSPVSFPVYAAKKSTRDKDVPVSTMISRKMLSFRQPCSLCARTVDVHTSVVLLPCSHISHTECYDEMLLNGRLCTWCENAIVRSPNSGRILRKKRTPLEHLMYAFCCMWSWR